MDLKLKKKKIINYCANSLYCLFFVLSIDPIDTEIPVRFNCSIPNHHASYPSSLVT